MAKSILCILTGDQCKCWVQKLEIIKSEIPMETANKIFELHNIANGEYAKAYSDDKETGYAGLDGLSDEILSARKLLKEQKDVPKEFLKNNSVDEDNSLSYEDIISKYPERYGDLKKLGLDDSGMFDDMLRCIFKEKPEEYYWINLCRVNKAQYERYTDELHHEYTVAELFAPEDLPFDLNDPDTVSIFGTGKFEAFADCSYGC